jgi:6-phosphogluconolactonase
MAELEVFQDEASLHAAAAQRICTRAADAVRQRGRFTLVLAGGSTPRGVYSLLAGEYRQQFPWTKTHFFWGDERHVPPDHPDSNYRMAWDAMLSRVPVPAENIQRIRAERSDPEQSAREYSSDILKFFGSGSGDLPSFDLALLGLGPDGHTASLFPDTAALGETKNLVVANWVEKFKSYRITMTLPLLNQAREIMFLVQGADKAPALRDALIGGGQPQRLPAQLIHPQSGKLTWLVDQQAASLLRD